MEPVRVYEQDSYLEMANKIFRDFVVGQFCTITGFLEVGTGVESKGQLVLDSIQEMDNRWNMQRSKDNRVRRKRVKMPNTIGDHVAQKTWRFEKRRESDNVIVNIWRIQ